MANLATKGELTIEGTSKPTPSLPGTASPTDEKIIESWQLRDWRKGGARKEPAGRLDSRGHQVLEWWTSKAGYREIIFGTFKINSSLDCNLLNEPRF